MDAPRPGHGTGMHQGPAGTAKSRAAAAGHKEMGRKVVRRERWVPKHPWNDSMCSPSSSGSPKGRSPLSSIPHHRAEPLPAGVCRTPTPSPPHSCSSSHPAPKLQCPAVISEETCSRKVQKTPPKLPSPPSCDGNRRGATPASSSWLHGTTTESQGIPLFQHALGRDFGVLPWKGKEAHGTHPRGVPGQ